MNTSSCSDGSNTLTQPRTTIRVAIVVSHPIQHFTPFYRMLAAQPGLLVKVFFCSRIGLDSYVDPGFGVAVKWDMDMLSGYESEFLDGASEIRATDFWTVYNPDIASKLKAFAPQVVHVYGYSQRTILLALAWCALHRVPVLMSSDSELLSERSRFKRLAKRVVLPLVFRTVTGFLITGDNNEAYYRHYGARDGGLFRSPLPTNDEWFLKALERRDTLRHDLRLELEVPAHAVVAVFVGKLIGRKRPHDLLAAVQRVRQRTNAELIALFVGDGELRSSLEQMSQEHGAQLARFAGFTSQSRLPAMLAAADLIVHPAERDPHPLSVTEGVLMGLPAIVSDKVGSVGPTDTVRDGFNGLVFPTGDVDALASALERLVCDPALRARMSQACRTVAQETGISASVEGYVRAVRAVVRPQHGT